MKPQYIFAPVIAICLMMGLLLPQLTRGRPTASAAAPQPLQSTQVVPNSASLGDSAANSDSAVSLANNLAGAAQALVDQAVNAAAPTIAPVEQQVEPQPTAPPTTLEAPVFPQAEGLPTPTPIPATPGLPDLAGFAASLPGGAANQVVGVYAEGLFALPVIEQPAGQENFVSGDDGVITRYATPGYYGSIGLLAHNYLSGKAFFNLKQNTKVTIIFGDKRQATFQVRNILYYQALSPYDPYSNFIDMADSGKALQTYAQVFNRVYTNSGQVVFQTCFEANGDPSWGRMFVIAEPL